MNKFILCMQLTGAHETAVLCMLVAYALFISYAAGCPPVLLLATKMILEKGMAWKGEEKKDNLTLVAFVLLYGLGHVPSKYSRHTSERNDI